MDGSNLSPTPGETLPDTRRGSSELFLRYARSRVRHFGGRQVLSFGGALTLGALISWPLGFLTLALALTGEAIDCLYLRYLIYVSKTRKISKTDRRIASITAVLQILTIAACISLAWVNGNGSDTHYFAMAFLFGACLNAGLTYPYFKRASQARIVVLASVGVGLFATEYISRSGDLRTAGFELLNAVILAYIVGSFLVYANRSFRRQRQFRKEILLKSKELAQINRRLVEKERHFRELAHVAEFANDSVIITGSNRRVSWVNRAFTKITGYLPEEAIGREIADLVNGPETSAETIGRISQSLRNFKPIRTEILNYTKSGDPIWVEANISPILAEDGSLINTISIERDITKSKEREADLADAKQLAEEGERAKSSFLAAMSHEIRTPMNGIIGMADLLTKTELNEEQNTFATTIMSSGEALLRIIDDILDLSKLDAGSMKILSEPFSLSNCISESVALLQPLARDKDLALGIEISPDIEPYYLGDAGRIRQIVLNLLGNAIKFTETGAVDVEVTTTKGDAGDVIMVSVTDTGVGISPTALAHIFEEFAQEDETTTQKFGGTGLGLSISRKFAREMAGDITASSTHGAGSSFILSLPLEPSSPVAEEDDGKTRDIGEAKTLAEACVLVAEDNQTNSLLIRKMLESHVGSLIFAKDGYEAIEKFRDHRPDLILMDMSMPRKDGLQATRGVRQIEETLGVRPCAIFALTANAYESDRERCLKAGMDGFLTKPVRRDDLLKNVKGQFAPD